ncbi:MAG: acetate--CoA ligase family protein [Candidatus Aminicenantes bacterium]|nr:acetate--CoA ligase family protein [Candidatus Aminicenantes bacterium]
MAKLYEYQSKKLLKDAGIRIPEGGIAGTPREARDIAEALGRPVVLKIQAWVTGRAALGGIQFAATPEEAEAKARELLGLKVKAYVVDRILVEEQLAIRAEYFAGLVLDDARKIPLLIFSPVGGSGVEEIARLHPERIVTLPIDVRFGLREFETRNLARRAGLTGPVLMQVADILARLYKTARAVEARSAEVNPLVLAEDGNVYAADCHLVVDDYAVHRHPELGIEIAREFDRPPTGLEKIAYKVEEKDHRGTFYFLQMAEAGSEAEGETLIGFHGAGGGGSMMSMDAVLAKGFKLANYCDTSGNPPASKVYRAAKIILSQPGLRGYFASGSGVASQEQYNSARGLVKAFAEEGLEIPAVIRLGGNCEEEAIRILASYLKRIPGRVEGYGRDDAPEFCAARMETLIREGGGAVHAVRTSPLPEPVAGAFAFATSTGRLSIDQSRCTACVSKGCVGACTPGILKLEQGRPVLAVSAEEAGKGKCTECLACEIYCRYHEQAAILIQLPIPGLDDYRKSL